jgi:hypothetical protein
LLLLTGVEADRYLYPQLVEVALATFIIYLDKYMADKMSPREWEEAEGFDPINQKDDVEFPDETLKRIEYQHAEGITPATELLRQQGKLPKVEEVLGDLERQASEAELRPIPEQLYQDYDQLRQLVAEVRQKLETIPPGPAQDEERTAWLNAQNKFRKHLEDFRAGLIADEDFEQHVDETNRRLLEIRDRITA